MIEAQGTVRANDIRRLKNPFDIYRVRPVYQYNLDEVISYLVNKLNKKYDYLGVIFLGILKLFRFKNTANKWQRDRDYFCSELVDLAFWEGRLDLIPGKKIGIASPGDIAMSKVVELI